MRKLTLLMLLAMMALPAFAIKRVTVAQLESALTANHGKSDSEIARRISGMELTERLSAAKLEKWKKELSGSEAQHALTAMASGSAFFDPPPNEIPSDPAPDAENQRQLINRAGLVMQGTLTKLPNFFADRIITMFEDTPPAAVTSSHMPYFLPYQPLHQVDRFTAQVFYRDHKEVVDWGETTNADPDSASLGLVTSGEFGPILQMVLADSSQGKLNWSHWEQGADGSLAVFRYTVPREKSHYQVTFCCVPVGSRSLYKQFSGYHGEMALDAINGTIRRLTVQADLMAPSPMTKAELMVEYGPVDIGGKTYICPLKSVTLVVAQEQTAKAPAEYLNWTPNSSASSPDDPVVMQTMLIDTVYAKYHMFRSESRILTGNEVAPKEK